MAYSTRKNEACLRVRVATRLAWLDVTQVDFASAIGMDKSSLSRVIRMDSPRLTMVQRIALGLGLEVSDLDDGSDPTVLVTSHPAIESSMSRKERANALRDWYENESSSLEIPEARHCKEAERHARRVEVREAMLSGEFNLEFVRMIAKKYGVSTSQIYADRTRIANTEGILR